jgi:hypothetical protein
LVNSKEVLREVRSPQGKHFDPELTTSFSASYQCYEQDMAISTHISASMQEKATSSRTANA